jgi:hypothetical protein
MTVTKHPLACGISSCLAMTDALLLPGWLQRNLSYFLQLDVWRLQTVRRGWQGQQQELERCDSMDHSRASIECWCYCSSTRNGWGYEGASLRAITPTLWPGLPQPPVACTSPCRPVNFQAGKVDERWQQDELMVVFW